LLKQACEQRPEDGDLWLAAANHYADFGQLKAAKSLLKQAQGKTSQLAWLRAMANFAQVQGNAQKAIQYWQQVVELAPLNIEAIRALAQLLIETRGIDVGLDFLHQACLRFPHSFTLHQIYLTWLEDQDIPAAIQIAQHLIQIDPHNAWPHRRLVYLFTKQQNFEQAFTELEIARNLEPHHLGLYFVWADLAAATGDLAQARQVYLQAIQESIDADWAIASLLNSCDNLEQRRQALADIYQELVRQVCFGDGLLAYQEVAVTVLEPTELLQQLQEAQQIRPDLWQAWSALIRQHLQLDQAQPALTLALAYTQRFPLLPRAWLDLAEVYRQQRDIRGEEKALKRVLNISPNWDLALQSLSDLYQRTQRLQPAAELLQGAIQRSPRNVVNYGYLAQLYGQQQRYPEAIETLTQALRIRPNYSWGWGKLKQYCLEINQPERAEQLVRGFCQQHPQDPQAWLRLAETLCQPEHQQERLKALAKALELDPYLVSAHDLKAELLAEAEQFSEAAAACEVNIGSVQPVSLQLRRAWIEKIQGNSAEALRRVRSALQQNPQHEWGWYLLAQLTWDNGDAESCLEAAQRLIRLDNTNSLYWEILGKVQRWRNKLTDAAVAYQRALDCSPANTDTGLTLFYLQVKASDGEAAASTLGQMEPYLSPSERAFCQIQLAALRQDAPQALRAFTVLCQVEISADYLMEGSVAAMQAAGWHREVAEHLQPLACRSDASELIVQTWLKAAVAMDDLVTCETYLTQKVPPELTTTAYCTYLEAIATPVHKKAVLQFVRKHRRTLNGSTPLWGYTGYALRKVQANAQALKWLKDWAKRPNVKPWMLLNLNEVIRTEGWGYTLQEVVDFTNAVLRKDEDYSFPLHRCWLSFDLARITTQEIDNLHTIEAYKEYPEYQSLRCLIQALLILKGKTGAGQSKLLLLDRYLDQALAAYPQIQSDQPFYKAYHCAVWKCFEITGHPKYLSRWFNAAFLNKLAPIPETNQSTHNPENPDFQEFLDYCRQSFGDTPRRFAPWRYYTYLRTPRPSWARFSRDPLKIFYQRQKTLLQEGIITWGVIVQANNYLFHPHHENLPADVLYCSDLHRLVDPKQLRVIAKEVFRLKNTSPEDQELAGLSAHITDEYDRHFGLAIPPQLSPDFPTELTTIMVDRQHLPNGYLSRGYFPVLVSPKHPRVVMILPSCYWSQALIDWWISDD
jgi:tetratricopeptide (TPR) repeat protein